MTDEMKKVIAIIRLFHQQSHHSDLSIHLSGELIEFLENPKNQEWIEAYGDSQQQH